MDMSARKPKLTEQAWAIFSGRICLVWSIRTTKKLCITNYLNECRRDPWELHESETCRKVAVSWSKP
jgi:hypothetical protein